MVPCKDCITFAICKGKLINKNCSPLTMFHYGIIPTCSIIRDYLNITEYTDYGFSYCPYIDEKDRFRNIAKIFGFKF